MAKEQVAKQEEEDEATPGDVMDLEDDDLDLDISDDDLGAAAEDDEPAAKAEQSEADSKKVEEAPQDKAEEAPPAEQEQSEEQETPAAKQVPATTQEAQREQAPQYTPEQLYEMRRQANEAAQATLTEHYAKLVAEHSDELEADPAKVYPVLLSRVFLDAVQSITPLLMQQMPQVMSQLQTQQKSEAQYIDEFFEKFPSIDRNNKEHWATAERLGQAYRAAYPNASPEEVIRDVGVQTMVMLRLPMGEEEAQAAPQSKPATQKAFSPARAQPPRSSPKAPDNRFTQVDEELFGVDDMDLG